MDQQRWAKKFQPSACIFPLKVAIKLQLYPRVRRGEVRVKVMRDMYGPMRREIGRDKGGFWHHLVASFNWSLSLLVATCVLTI